MTPNTIMFHHFHDEGGHIRSQGSMAADTFRSLIELLQKRHEILNPEIYLERVLSGTILPHETCLTFDDSLKCQFDIALPVLESLNLKAFWFIYTSIYDGVMDKLEIYRTFRAGFGDIDIFYSFFFNRLRECDSIISTSEYIAAEKAFESSSFLAQYLVYSVADRKFRYFRDIVLGNEKYTSFMDMLLSESNFNTEELVQKLWVTPKDIKYLHAAGHTVGLHGHIHFTRMCDLPFDEQYAQYSRNKSILSSFTGDAPICVSYPNGSYNNDTGAIMKDLGVRIGFDSLMHDHFSALHIPRMDHALLLREMEGTL